MGDYTKLIVNCGVKKMTDEEVAQFREELLERAYLCTSAYHCGGELLEIENKEWRMRTDVTFVTQLKYSKGLEEFIKWLRPQVVDGFGKDEWFAMSCTERQDTPTLYCKKDIAD